MKHNNREYRISTTQIKQKEMDIYMYIHINKEIHHNTNNVLIKKKAQHNHMNNINGDTIYVCRGKSIIL